MSGCPYVFDEFFASGREETISPFLTPSSRNWGKNLPIKAAILAAILLACAFVLSFFSTPGSHLCLSAVYFLVGTPALLHAIEDVCSFEINIDVLMTLAALLSVVIGSGLEGGLLLVLFEFSGAMENAVTQKTKNALIALRKLSPKTAHVVEGGKTIEQAVDKICVGTEILIRSGELIPLDGQVVAGGSSVNLIHLTGESLPMLKRVGDTVPAGAANLDGTLTLKVTRSNADSTLSRILTLITEAQSAKPKLQRFFDTFGKGYSTAIIALSFFFALALPLLIPMPFLGIKGSVYRALAFLIAASPCALIIATPTAYLSAISSCAKRGILLKGGSILDAIASCSTVAFDKTGTLTTGSLICSKIEPLHRNTLTEEEALCIAAGLETHAVHPIARAILQRAHLHHLQPTQIHQFQNIPGYGLRGMIERKGQQISVFIGHPDFIKRQYRGSIPLPSKQRPNTLLLVEEELFAFHFEDELRCESPITLSQLANQGLSTVLLTGDHIDNAALIGRELAIETVLSDLRPEDKLQKVATLSEQRGLIMVGDGMNDAPALARATVGISMGKVGSATAIDASDVVFLNDDLTNLTWLYTKAQKAMRIVRQNLVLALGVICLCAAPALFGQIPIWLAVLLHEGGTVIVGFNSLRLLR